jgi:hypothetical protein
MKTAIAVIAGFFVWFAIVYVLGFVMRTTWSDYAAVAEAMTFTLPMMFARLSIGIVASLVAGRVAAGMAPKPMAAAIALGVVLLLFFIPEHILLWNNFPVWYHLFFLLSLIPLSMLGARIGRRVGKVEAGAVSA